MSDTKREITKKRSIHFRIAPGLKRDADRRAKRLGIPLSEHIRSLLEQDLKDEKAITFKCEYCKKSNSAMYWDRETERKCGKVDVGIEEGYKSNRFYVCPSCGENNYNSQCDVD